MSPELKIFIDRRFMRDQHTNFSKTVNTCISNNATCEDAILIESMYQL